jgi:predicted peptidase
MKPMLIPWIAAAALIVFGSGLDSASADDGSVAPDAVHSTAVATGFISFTTTTDGETRKSVVFVPDDYSPGREWPLIVFLHGMGERGNDGWKQTEVGIGRAIRLNPDRFPALVLMPQCSPSTVWSSMENQNGAPSWKCIDAAIDVVRDRYNVDAKRMTLTGLSMGGYGTFRYGAMRADRFAAFMPVCGGGNPDDAAQLARRPLWAFHGLADTVVKPDKSREMVEAVRAAGGDAELTEYEGVGHNSWDKAYGDPAAIEWLLSQSR